MKCDECGVEYTVKPSVAKHDSKCFTCTSTIKAPIREKSRPAQTGERGTQSTDYSILDHAPYWWLVPLGTFVLFFGGTITAYWGELDLFTAGLIGVGVGVFGTTILAPAAYYGMYKKHRCQECGTKWAAVLVRTWSTRQSSSTLYHIEMKCRECGADYTVEATVEDE